MRKTVELGFFQLTETATVPVKNYQSDTGIDVWADESKNVVIKPCSKHLFKTNIAPIIPEGWGLNVADRSSYGVKGITYTAGVIDQEYTGNIGVILVNTQANKIFVLSVQPKEFVEKCQWFDIYNEEFVEKATEEMFEQNRLIHKGALVIKYATDAIAQLCLTEVPITIIKSATKEEYEAHCASVARGKEGYGSSNK